MSNKVLVIVERGVVQTYHDDGVEVAVVDFDNIRAGEVPDLPENWNPDWADDFPVAVEDINERIANTDSVPMLQ